jgi:iron complex outermembrane receptor protein
VVHPLLRHAIPISLAVYLLASFGFPLVVSAQEPVRADSTRRDSGAVVLPEVTVNVTRVPEPLRRIPAAVSVLDSNAIRRGRPTLGLSESLNELPGVYVTNRYNFSLDERLTIRGFGSRSNFGIRGIQILLDGVPQTAPDGQTQMSNVDLDVVNRAEVLRGSASALYGNSSGGVVSLSTIGAGSGPSSLSARLALGSFGFLKANVLGIGTIGRVAGTLSLSHTDWDGFRQHSAANFTMLSLGADWMIDGSNSLSGRIRYTDQPEAQNPGALTYAEYEANRDSASASNILRDAGKDVNQVQASLAFLHVTAGGDEYQATIFGIGRNLLNPLAAPPPQGPGPDVGTYVTIDRSITGLRLSGITRLDATALGLRLNYGVDLQGMRDHRTNARSVGGVPDTLVQDQVETVTEVGPFVQATWNTPSRVTLSAGLRYDWMAFNVEDQFLGDGADNSDQRGLHAPSGQIGISYDIGAAFVPYFNVATSFETPTTTEMANAPGVTGGFNPDLDPQTAVTWELGARGRWRWLSYSVAGFLIGIEDAITQYTEVGGRAYFTNAGKVNNNGIEARVDVTPTPTLRLFASYTYSHFRFGEYRLVFGAVTDTLDGNTVPAVPESFLRLGLRAKVLGRGYVDVDQSFSTKVFANDQNTLLVNGWGSQTAGMPGGIGGGVMNVVVGWEGEVGQVRLAPFGGIANLFDRSYVGSVTVNGAFGRVYEPSPRRSFYVGAELGWRGETPR